MEDPLLKNVSKYLANLKDVKKPDSDRKNKLADMAAANLSGRGLLDKVEEEDK